MPLIVIAIYSRPCVDDLTYSCKLYHYVQSGSWNFFGLIEKAFEVDMQYYQEWQGLYSSAFLLALQPGIFGNEVYFVGAWVLMAIGFVCILYFVKTVFKITKIKSHYVFLSIFLFVFLMQHLPSIYQGLYWYNGAWNYVLFFFLSLLNIALCLKYAFAGQRNWCIVVACILSFLISGGNHVTGFMNILLLACTAGLVAFKRKEKWKVLLPLAFAAVGFVIMYVAPGTAARQSYFSKPGLVTTLVHSFAKSLTFTGEFCAGNCFFYVLAMFIFALFTYKKHKFNKDSFKLSPILLILVAWAIMWGMLCVPYYATACFGEGRLWNVVWMYEIVAIGALVVYSTWYVMHKHVETRKLESCSFLNVVFVASVFICVFWINGNYFEASRELCNGQAVTYAEAYDERIELMNDASAGETLYVGPLPESKALRFDDENEDTFAWFDYYGSRIETRE